MKRSLRLITAITFAGGMVGAALAQSHRHAGAHQHGHGRLDIAIDGSTVSILLDVPADDLVGFEHAAKTKAEIAKVEAAKAKLEQPLTLFDLSKAAGCTLQQAKVTMAKTGDSKVDGHADVQAEYTLSCTAVSEIKTIEFVYFKAFKSAEALTVNLVGPTGQTSVEVTRKRPRVALPSPKS